MKGFSRPARSYFWINLIIAGMIIAIFIYSGFFSPTEDSYPVKCVHQVISGIPCPSCGLSHSFSSLIRGDIDSASGYNSNGPALFLFFIFHLVLRISNLLILRRSKTVSKNLALMDIVLSLVTFILAFWPFIIYNLAIAASMF